MTLCQSCCRVQRKKPLMAMGGRRKLTKKGKPLEIREPGVLSESNPRRMNNYFKSNMRFTDVKLPALSRYT